MKSSIVLILMVISLLCAQVFDSSAAQRLPCNGKMSNSMMNDSHSMMDMSQSETISECCDHECACTGGMVQIALHFNDIDSSQDDIFMHDFFFNPSLHQIYLSGSQRPPIYSLT